MTMADAPTSVEIPGWVKQVCDPVDPVDLPEIRIEPPRGVEPGLIYLVTTGLAVIRLRGAEELRVKESDRIQAMADGLTILGVETTVYEDGIDVVGRAGDGASYGGGQVDSLGDHRIAMAFAVAALRASEPVVIDDCANVATSFPGFVALANKVGLELTEAST